MNIQHKTSPKRGLWKEQVPHAPSPVCVCGNKYIKTRKNQTTCIACIYRPDETFFR